MIPWKQWKIIKRNCNEGHDSTGWTEWWKAAISCSERMGEGFIHPVCFVALHALPETRVSRQVKNFNIQALGGDPRVLSSMPVVDGAEGYFLLHT